MTPRPMPDVDDDGPITAADVGAARAFFHRRRALSVAAGLAFVVVATGLVAFLFFAAAKEKPALAVRRHQGELLERGTRETQPPPRGQPATLIEDGVSFRVVVDGKTMLTTQPRGDE